MLSRRALAGSFVITFFSLAGLGYASIDGQFYTFNTRLDGGDVSQLGTRCIKSIWLWIFLTLFAFRYTRMIGNIIAYYAYKPTPLPMEPQYKGSDVTFIVTTIDPYRSSFVKTISNILVNKPAKVLVAVAGKDIDWKPLANCLCYRNIEVVRLGGAPSKRRQMMAALTKVTTPLVAFVDDRVYIPPTYVKHMLPPLSDPSAGVVTPAVLTQRFDHGKFSWDGFWNFIGCLYILRRNFDRQAINTIDGGISTVPGRAFVIRAEIMKDPDYMNTFLNEYMTLPFIGTIGPVNAGEDTFTTRWLLRKGWKIKVQQCPETTVETDNLGVWPRFKDQLSRWSRSSIRSRLCQTLVGWSYISRYPWTFYAVNVQSLTNFPLFVDGALIFTLYKAINAIQSQRPEFFIGTMTVMALFLTWLVASKLVKLIPHFKTHPWDLLYFPFYIIFINYHTFHRLHALFTMANNTWAGRYNVDDFEAEKNARHANVFYKDGVFHHVQPEDAIKQKQNCGVSKEKAMREGEKLLD